MNVVYHTAQTTLFNFIKDSILNKIGKRSYKVDEFLNKIQEEILLMPHMQRKVITVLDIITSISKKSIFKKYFSEEEITMLIDRYDDIKEISVESALQKQLILNNKELSWIFNSGE